MWQCASMIFFGWVATVSPFRTVARACAMRASHSSRVSNVLGRHDRRLVEQPGAVARVELDDLERRTSGRRGVERQLRRRVQGAPAAHVHLEAVRAERRDVLEQDDPLGALAAGALEPLARELLALLARDLAVAVAERGVAHRLVVHQRRASAARARDRLAHELAPLAARRRRARPRCVRRASSSAIARTTPMYCWYSVGVDHHGRVDPRLGPAPRRDRGLAVQHEHALRRSRCSAGRHARATRSAPSRARRAGGRADALHQQVLGEAVQRAGGEAAGEHGAALVHERPRAGC